MDTKLMEGNWVNHLGNYEQIVAIDKSDLNSKGRVKFKSNMAIWVDIEEVEPIVVTEEIIEKLFLYKEGTRYYLYSDTSTLMYDIGNGQIGKWPDDGCTDGHIVWIDSQYVHELQNIFYYFQYEDLGITFV